jgi:tetratricopeptide (TPR) repeat protein
MTQIDEFNQIYNRSAHRFAEHYRSYVQTYQTNFGMLDEDLENIIYALNTFKHADMWLDTTYFVLTLDDFLEVRGYWKERRFWLEQIVEHNKTFDNLKVRTQILQSLAEVTSAQGSLEKAEQIYWQVVDLAKEINDNTHLAAAYYSLYSLYQNQGQLDKAQSLLEQVSTLAQQTDNQVQEKVAHYFLEIVKSFRKERKESPKLLSLVGQISAILGQAGKAHTLSMRAWVHLKLNQYGQAKRYYLKALEIVRQNKDAQGIAFVLYQLGLIASLENDLTTALTYFQESRLITEQINSQTGLLLLYSTMGLIYLKQGHFDLALSYLEESVVLAQHSGDQQQIAENLYWLGYAVANTGEPEYAVEIFRESLEIFIKLNSPEADKVKDTLTRLQVRLSESKY